MNLIKSLKNNAAKFQKNESGQFGIMFALTASMLLVTVGLSVDYARLVSARSQLNHALDAAVLSTARDITRNKIDKKEAAKIIRAFLEANLDGQRLTKSNVRLTDVRIDPVTNELSAEASTDVEMMFPVMNIDKYQKVDVKIGALYSERKVEVSMVLDVTGSMADPVGGSTKIKELKIAAKSAVKAFLQNGSDNTRVAITPYSFGVNVGNGLLKAQVVDESGNPTIDSCATERRGPLMFSDASPVAAKVTRARNINYFDVNSGQTWSIGLNASSCPGVAIQPLTRDAKALNNMIDKFSPVGGTAGQIGLQWGWYMLSPNWKSALPVASAPVAYGTPESEKYLILMTDGLFNSHASGLADGDIATFPGIAMPSGRLAMSYCNSMKDQRIKVYTIGFDLKNAGNAGQQAEAVKMLTDCATAPVGSEKTFYNAENGADLKKAFDEIAARIQSLRLTN